MGWVKRRVKHVGWVKRFFLAAARPEHWKNGKLMKTGVSEWAAFIYFHL